MNKNKQQTTGKVRLVKLSREQSNKFWNVSAIDKTKKAKKVNHSSVSSENWLDLKINKTPRQYNISDVGKISLTPEWKEFRRLLRAAKRTLKK